MLAEIMNINKELEELKNRKIVTPQAIKELFGVVTRLEKSIMYDLETTPTQTKTELKYDVFSEGNNQWNYAKEELALKISEGKIVLNNYTCKFDYETHENIYTHKSITDFLEDSKVNIFGIDFKLLTKALIEVIKLGNKEAKKIDEAAQNFIDLAQKWLQENEKEEN